MIFVDTNVFMYAVGRVHPLKSEAREFFARAVAATPRPGLVTSAEVLQELLHVYLPVNRHHTLSAALELVQRVTDEIWPLEADDVRVAHELASEHPTLGARDLIHLACCRRRGVDRIQTFDRALAGVFE